MGLGAQAPLSCKAANRTLQQADPTRNCDSLRSAPKTFHFHGTPSNGTSSPHAPGNMESRPMGAYPVSPEAQAPLLYDLAQLNPYIHLCQCVGRTVLLSDSVLCMRF